MVSICYTSNGEFSKRRFFFHRMELCPCWLHYIQNCVLVNVQEHHICSCDLTNLWSSSKRASQGSSELSREPYKGYHIPISKSGIPRLVSINYEDRIVVFIILSLFFICLPDELKLNCFLLCVQDFSLTKKRYFLFGEKLLLESWNCSPFVICAWKRSRNYF